MILFFDKIPREFGKQRHIAYSKEEFFNIINYCNGIADCFTTTFDYSGLKIENDKELIDRATIIIPHILFDLDSDQCYEDMKKLHNYCKSNNLSHRVIFSGRGFHVYILTKYNPEISIIDVLHYQNKLINTLSINVDRSCVGNVSHMIRIPGTFNPKRNRWCISLREDELEYSYQSIRSLAMKQRTKIYTIRGEYLELPHQNSSHVITETQKYSFHSLPDTALEYKVLIPCLRTNVLLGGHIPHMERVYIVQYLSEFYRCGVSIKELTEGQIQEIVEKIVEFFEPIVNDFNESKTRAYVDRIVRTNEYSPSCERFKALGLCIDNVHCWRR